MVKLVPPKSHRPGCGHLRDEVGLDKVRLGRGGVVDAGWDGHADDCKVRVVAEPADLRRHTQYLIYTHTRARARVRVTWNPRTYGGMQYVNTYTYT